MTNLQPRNAVYTQSGPSTAAVNTRLIAAVQNGAGARSHEAASLLQCYYFCAEIYKRAGTRMGVGPRDEFRRAEVQLRRFLTQPLLA
jgi:hypothetical protein